MTDRAAARMWRPTIEIAPGFHPMNQPGPGDWVVLGTAREVGWSRGRQQVLDDYETSQAAIVLDNGDESLDQLLPGSPIEACLPYTPIRIRATKLDEDGEPTGRSRVRWSGYTRDGFEPQGLRGSGTVVVAAIDWLGWAATIRLPESRFAAWVQSERPLVWLRGDTTRQSIEDPNEFAFNSAQLWEPAYGDAIPDTGYGPFIGARRATSGSLVPGSSIGALEFGSTGIDSGITMTDAVPQVAGPWSCWGWFKVSTGSFGIVFASTDWQVSTNASGHLVAVVDVGGSLESATIAVNHSDGNPHLFSLAVTSTGGFRSMTLQSDLGANGHSFGAAAVSGGGTMSIRGSDSSQAQEFAYFDHATSLPGAITRAQMVAGTDSLWFGDDQADRLGHLLDTAGVPSPGFALTIDPSPTPARSFHEYDQPSSLADGVRSVAASFLGGAWCEQGGAVRVRDATFSSATSAHYDRVFATLTDDPTLADGRQHVVAFSDNFNRADNPTVLGGSWSGTDGSVGVLGNKAYVSAAHGTRATIRVVNATLPDHRVTATLASAVDGQGVVVRYADTSNYIAAVKNGATVEVFIREFGVNTVLGSIVAAPGPITLEAYGPTIKVTAGAATGEWLDPGILSPLFQRSGIIYTPTSTPSSSMTWDDVEVEKAAPTVVRCTTRKRTGYLPNRVINDLTVALFGDRDVRAINWASKRRFGHSPKSLSSESSQAGEIVTLAQQIVVDKADPPVEVGSLVIRPWGREDTFDWLIEECDLDRRVAYEERQYRSGTQVIDADMRVGREVWRWSDVNVEVTLTLVPA